MQKSGRNGIYAAIKLSRVGGQTIRRTAGAVFTQSAQQIYVNFQAVTVSFCSQVQPRLLHPRAVTVSTRIYGAQAS